MPKLKNYLEDWAREIAKASEKAWKSSTKITVPFAYLLATIAERIGVPQTLQGNSKDSTQRLADEVTKFFPKYYKQINENHGVKGKNILQLLGPLGVPSSALGATLLPNLESFGALRGAYAHKSARAVAQVLDPETEYKRVYDLVQELAPLDQWLVAHKRRVK